MENQDLIGIFLKRENILLPRVKKIPTTLHIQLLEVKLLIKAIDAYIDGQYQKFDATSVGDCKCQVRASIILDLVQNKAFLQEQLEKDRLVLLELSERLHSVIARFNFDNFLEIKKVMSEVKDLSMYEILINFNLNFMPSQELVVLGLCFFSTMRLNELDLFVDQLLSKQKLQSLLIISKKRLSALSIEYEQFLACQYSNQDIQTAVQSIVTNGYHDMTSFFPPFKAILSKMKHVSQAFVLRREVFCRCGGVRGFKFNFYRYVDGQFKECFLYDSLEGIMVIEGYQFYGTLSELKCKLNVPDHLVAIPKQFITKCTCNVSLNVFEHFENAEEAILANFAQHAQFTNGAEIDWSGLGLEHSDLKKEYDYLKTLPGYGIDDMSKFCIRHIYASTITQVLQEQRVLQEQLEHGVVNAGSEK